MVKKKAVRKKAIRKHEVRGELSNFQLAKAKSALTLQIYSHRRKVGELHIGRGSLFWWGTHKQIGKRVSWTRFTQTMNRLVYGNEA